MNEREKQYWYQRAAMAQQGLGSSLGGLYPGACQQQQGVVPQAQPQEVSPEPDENLLLLLEDLE